jgi:pimeloyl-ACP methyl ester carboxylesterase
MAGETTWRDHLWTSHDGLTLHARVYGAPAAGKLPVVCIPGLTRNARDFEEVAPWIAAQGRQVFAVDLCGRGQSDRDTDPRRYQPRVYAQDMASLLRSVGAAKALFIGTSLGGLVTMALTSAHARLIGGAVLNDVGPRVAKAGLKRIGAYAGKGAPVNDWADAAAYVKRTNGVAFPDMPDEAWTVIARRLFKDEGGRPALDYDPHIIKPANPFVIWLTQPVLWSMFRRLGRCGPLLLVHGAITDILDAPTIARMQRAAPNMKVAAVAGVGHAPWLTEPAAREAIADWLREAP